MKKQIRAAIIATIITCIIIISSSFAMPAFAEDRGEFYPKLTIVVSSVKIDSQLWVVDCKDKNGNIWSFFDDEGVWKQGDIINLLMWKMGENEKEDEILEVYWEGYTDNLKMFFGIMNGCP